MIINCVHCRKPISISITEEQYNNWNQNNYIQDEFPQLTPAEREMLLSGICEDCWNILFKEEEE